MPSTVEPLRVIRRQQLRSITGRFWWRVGVPAFALASGLVAARGIGGNGTLSDPGPPPEAAFALAAVIAALVAMALTWAIAKRRASRAAIEGWARRRGWTVTAGLLDPAATPLLRSGRRRASRRHVQGHAGGRQFVLCHHTFETAERTFGMTGTAVSQKRRVDHTVVQCRLSSTGLRRIAAHPRRGTGGIAAWIGPAAGGDRVVSFESVELAARMVVRARQGDDEIAVRRAVQPALIAWLVAEAAQDMLFEVENEMLVVAVPGHIHDAAALDRLVTDATAIATRLATVRPRVSGKEIRA